MALAQLNRHWAILKKIPNWGSAITISDLARYLINIEQIDPDTKKVTPSFIRKVQRDVEMLATVVELLNVDKSEREFKVSWSRNAPPIKISALSTPEVIAFGVLQELGTDLLPKNFQDVLSPFFKVASDQATAQGGNANGPASRWLQKIAHVSAGPGFLAPTIDKEVELAIHEALLNESCLEISYRGNHPTVVYPQAIVQQGVRTYLLAMPRGLDQTRTYMMHRIQRAKVTTGTYMADGRFNVENYVKQGISARVFPPDVYGTQIRLKLWVHRDTAWLEETPLARDQSFVAKDGDYELEATVHVTEELVRWLLSMSWNVKVLAPEMMRDRLKDDFAKAARLYAND
jgi:predicted DNA-binding transcriptional regulator YafY